MGMFYENQPESQREDYKSMLALIGSLSNLFADSKTPMLYYRAHENVFCKYFEADNLSREDCSADAMKGVVGIGLKTWVGRDDQKVAEFGRLRPTYEHLSGMELVKRIAEYRNERIRVTKKLHGLDEMIYHVVKRIPHGMQIYESAFDFVDIDNMVLDEKRGNANNTYFSDGKHTYHFSMSKNTLFMIFDDMTLLDAFDVEILEDPFEALKLFQESMRNLEDSVQRITQYQAKLCLRLYAVKADGTKYVPEKSGLNQWHAGGRARDENELYIPYLVEDRERDPEFFPARDTPFTLLLPDGTEMSAKVCQRAYRKLSTDEYNKLTQEEKEIEDAKSLVGKSIMSNPNKALGQWLLRDVFGLDAGTLVTYDMLRVFDVDSVMFTKIEDGKYGIDFCKLGTYEKMYDLHDAEAEEDVEE